MIINVPPRHAKTETILAAIARRTKRKPWQNIAYVTFADDVAHEKSTIAREYALRAGVVLREDTKAKQLWRTPELGGVRFTSIGGQILGTGADLLIIDDPHKGRPEAESPVDRERVWNWYIGTGRDRVEPGGSIICCQTRWHPDDMTGRLIDQRLEADGWEVISLPALGVWQSDGTRIADDKSGTALWPERLPLDELLSRRVDEYEWVSKYQQSPAKKGGNVFRGVRYYDPRRLPGGLRISVGIDCAYTKKTSADYSACVVLGQDPHGTVYVLAVMRAQVEINQFVEMIRGTIAPWPTARITWHTSTTEKGTAQLMRALNLNVQHEPAVEDKFIRSQPVASKWNAGLVLLPMGYDDRENGGQVVPAPQWVRDYAAEMTKFTGLGDKKDDQVDATASAYFPWSEKAKERLDSQ